LDEVARIMTADSTLQISVEGHADQRGSSAFNQALSERRALAVREYLVETGGVDPSRLSAQGFGESRPLDPRPVPEAYALNRRVELRVVASGRDPRADLKVDPEFDPEFDPEVGPEESP
ncbi:MAG: OmpA family protein, partial [Candidatus Eisenbacteria bacterium]|nr:OmpA family protein [Candidatus Eisenbacteria bacterium]